jgi:hypothetical protein
LTAHHGSPGSRGSDASGASGVPWHDGRVRFRVDHRFDASRDAIVELLTDPSFYRGLDLPDLGRPEVLDTRVEGRRAVVRLRYAFEGGLDPATVRLLGRDRLTWTQELEVDRGTATGAFRFEADVDPRHLHGRGTFVLEDSGGSTLLRFDGEFTVAVPGLGRMLERAVLPRLLHLLEVEARAADRQLRPPVRGGGRDGDSPFGREGGDPGESYTGAHERSG